MDYTHVNVFSPAPYTGNSLPVFPDSRGLSDGQMLRITQELRHFEAIFLEPVAATMVRARVFDLFGELPFAGHPIIGAAATLHRAAGDAGAQTWHFELTHRTVSVTTEATEHGYFGLLDQGRPEFRGKVQEPGPFLRAFGLEAGDLHPDLPLEVVSTGLPYLIVPVRPGALERARIQTDLTPLLHRVGAQFAVLLDEAALEVRHWNNDGLLEDVATGSAAGVVGAYRLRHGLAQGGEAFVLHQGRFTGRPSTLRTQPEGTPDHVLTVKVGGDVTVVGRGVLEVLP
ncbi:PhzF family phenazine biosynthesis protein [Deinococcus aetherius]|uniref:PhzF family phenazine biosynthesis protein n=1 Tax=Deinococcus aetherius TaxID=200252 RepID=UPI00222EEDFD|nr:PhzF family phenazine biosynthesis protein [Deinococcus aetherius]